VLPTIGLVRQPTGRFSAPFHLAVEDLLELLGKTAPHACSRVSLGIPIAASLPCSLGRRQVFVGLFHGAEVRSFLAATCYDPAAMELYGVRIPTIVADNVATRCSGCGEPIEGRPWRVSILDIVAPEAPVSWSESARLNPGPFEFHGDPSHVLAWMAARGMLFCRRSQVREVMRPVWVPTEPIRLGLCDGIHRDDHEFIDPATMAADPAPSAADRS
jgi:hypothetical protein